MFRVPRPSWVQRRALVIAAGASHPYVPSEWADALVTVERGCVDLIARDGESHRFESGAMLFLAGLSLRGLRNPGREDAELVAISRQSDSLSPAVPSHE